MSAHEHNDAGWFDKPENIRKIIVTLVVTCILLVIGSELTAYLKAEHPELAISKAIGWKRHSYFAVESLIPGFYAVFGFIAYCGIVWAAVGLRELISREEDYYD